MTHERRLKIIITVLLMITAITYQSLASPSYNSEADCRSCHWITVDRHHLLVQNGTFQCIDCHEMKWDDLNKSYYPEVIRNCLTCHPDKNHIETHHLLVEKGLYECTDCHPVKWNNDTRQYYIEAIWDCTVCHNNSANSYHGINIYSQFTLVNDSFVRMGMSKGYYNKVNMRHDISDDKSPFNRTIFKQGK